MCCLVCFLNCFAVNQNGIFATVNTSFQGCNDNVGHFDFQGTVGPCSYSDLAGYTYNSSHQRFTAIHLLTDTWLSLPSLGILHLAQNFQYIAQQMVQPIPALQEVTSQDDEGNMMEDVQTSSAGLGKPDEVYEIEDVEMEDVTPQEVVTWMEMLRADGKLVRLVDHGTRFL